MECVEDGRYCAMGRASGRRQYVAGAGARRPGMARARARTDFLYCFNKVIFFRFVLFCGRYALCTILAHVGAQTSVYRDSITILLSRMSVRSQGYAVVRRTPHKATPCSLGTVPRTFSEHTRSLYPIHHGCLSDRKETLLIVRLRNKSRSHRDASKHTIKRNTSRRTR